MSEPAPFALTSRRVCITGAAGGLGSALARAFAHAGAEPAESARIPVGRCGDPAEIARLAVLLASDAAAHIVGETVTADGGYVLA